MHKREDVAGMRSEGLHWLNTECRESSDYSIVGQEGMRVHGAALCYTQQLRPYIQYVLCLSTTT